MLNHGEQEANIIDFNYFDQQLKMGRPGIILGWILM